MDSNLTEAERQRAFRFCTAHLNGCWTNLKSWDLSIRKLSGGMSNLLYHCALAEWIETQNEPREVLLRLYGPSHGDMQVQLEIFNLLASENLGPRLYCAFQEGRLEEYLPSNPLSLAEMTDDSVSEVVATKLAAIHRLDVTSLDKKANWLIDNYNQFNDFITTMSKDSLRTNIRESTREIAIQLLETNFKPEIDFLDELFQNSGSPRVFSHNDLHQNNIILLLRDQDKDQNLQDRVVLIDFEYSSYNYRPFDMANHLMEWCFDYNGEEYPYFSASFERFPSKEQQKRFLHHYLKSSVNSKNQVEQCDKGNHCLNGLNSDAPTNGHDQRTDDEVEALYLEMQPFLMGSNLLWALWAIKSACTSEIEFGYWEMAKWKLDLYLLCKKRYLEKFM